LNQGYVTDFVRVGIPGVYYWPNFNVADSAIVCGVIGLAIYIFVEDIRTNRNAGKGEQSNASAKETQTAPDA
jgi:signal peptidase II